MSDPSASPTPPPSGANQPRQPKQGKQSNGIAVAQIIGAILLIVVIVFILENTRSVTMRLIFPEVKVSLAVALLIAALLGGLGVLLLQYRHRRKK